MAAAKKKKLLMYKDKPVFRKGTKIYYGNPEDRLILVIDILETKKQGDLEVASKVAFHIRDNTGETVGDGVDYRSGERDNLYKAFDIGSWWLQDALATM